MMTIRRFYRRMILCALVVVSGQAYAPNMKGRPPQQQQQQQKTLKNLSDNNKPRDVLDFVTKKVATATSSAALGISLLFLAATTTVAEPAYATSKLAAQIQLNSIPPTSIDVNIRDLPLVGEILSGTYTKVSEPIKNPSVTITSPRDKISAIKAAATQGHLEFDVNGGISTHLDIDLAADEPGVARVRVASPLIPQLPFKNPAASSPLAGGKTSEWFCVTNMGSGESYYYNRETGKTQYEKPDGY